MKTKTSKPKKVRNGEAEHRLLKYLSDRIGGPLDGYFGQNYDACSELIKRCKEHGSDPEHTITRLIDIATSDGCWHKKNVTNFRYLLNHGRAIWNSARDKGGAGVGDKERGVLEAIARQQGITLPDNG